MKSNKLFLFLLLAFATSVFAVPGDLNGDGVIDIADLVRVNAMIHSQTEVSTEADLNFDGTVDATDHDMLLAAIRGLEPLPTKVECSFNWLASTVNGSGFYAKFPYADSSMLRKVSVTAFDSLPNPPSKAVNCLTRPLVFYNLPRNSNEPELALDIPETAVSPALLIGTYVAAVNDGSPSWQYRIVTLDDEDETLDIENGKLVWHPECRTSANPSEVPLLLAVIQGKGQKTRAGNPEDSNGFQQCGSGEGYVKYRTEHFVIMDLNQNVDTARYLAVLLEGNYAALGELGFNQKFKWGNQYINVTLLDQESVSSKMVHSCVPPTLYGAPTLRINSLDITKVLSAQDDFFLSAANAQKLMDSAKSQSELVASSDFQERADRALKELSVTYGNAIAESAEFSQLTSSIVSGLAYYHFYNYRDALDITWLNEMCAGMIELCSHVFLTSVYKDIPLMNPMAFIPFGVPIISLSPSSDNDGGNASASALSPQLHGRGLLPFAVWLNSRLNKGKAQACQWLPRLFSSNGYRIGNGIQAIRDTLNACGISQTLPELYDEYVRECFTWGENAGSMFTANISQSSIFNVLESLKAGQLPQRENYDDNKRAWVLMEKLYDLQQADKFTSLTPHWLEEVGKAEPDPDEVPGFAATYSFQVPELSTATFLFKLNKVPGNFDFETQQFKNTGLYVMAKNVKDMDIFACYYDPEAPEQEEIVPSSKPGVAYTIIKKKPDWVCNPPEAVSWDETKENCMMVFDMNKICPALMNKDNNWEDRNFGICIVNPKISNSSTPPTIELGVGFEGPLVFKNTNSTGSWSLTNDNDVVACEIHTTELSVSPLDKTLFIGANTEKYTLNSANIIDYGTVSIGIPKNEPPKELKFNLTAELTNIPHEQVYWDEAGYDVRLEATGKYLVMVMKLKNISDQSLTNVDYDSSGLGTTYVDGNMRGKLFSAADFAPVWKPSEVPLPPGADPNTPNLVKTTSNLNITIPDYDVNSPYYVIQIDAEYNIIEIRGEQAKPKGTITRTCTLVRLEPQILF